MKKILLLAVLVCFGLTVKAQEESIRFGVKAGLNLSNFNGDIEEGFDMRTSIHIGGVVEIPIYQKIAFAPELIYSTQGSDYMDSAGLNFNEESTIKLDYLNLPLMAKYYIIKGLSIQAGPQIGFLLSAKDEGEITILGQTREFDVNIKEGFKDIDFGLNFGAGYQLDLGIFFDARYNLGLTDLADSREEGDNNSTQNGVFQFSVGYKF